MAEHAPVWLRFATAAREIWSGATGEYAYEAYREHRAKAHPGCAVASRAEYERQIKLKRYEGISRCC